jgi:hypothetical protein
MLRNITSSGGAQSGPDRGALSGALTGVSFIAGVGGALIRADDPYPRPGSTAGDVQRYFTQNAGAARLSVAGQLVSAASLARFTSSAVRLAGRSGAGSRALQAAAVAGGALATASLATAALSAAALTGRPGRDARRAVALHRRAFLAGGPVHGAGFGVLLGALGLAGRRTGELPAGLTRAALGAAVPNLLSPLYLVAEPAGWLIPIGRFPGLIVAGVAGTRLAR